MTKLSMLVGFLLAFTWLGHAQQAPASGEPVPSSRAALPETPPLSAFNCTPTPEKLHAETARLRAQFPDNNEFLRALDHSFGFDSVFLSTHPAMIVLQRNDLSIIAASPYVGYRASLLEALRKREPIDDLQALGAFLVIVSPSRPDAPDIVNVVVERDGKEIQPTINNIRPTTITTRLGAKAVLHSGQALFPCSVFAPGAVVKVIAIPEIGRNIEKTLPDNELAGFSPQGAPLETGIPHLFRPQATTRFELRLAEGDPQPGLTEVIMPGTAQKIYLHNEAIVTIDDIVEARAMARDDGRGYYIAIIFNQLASERLGKATAGHVGKPLAILVDGEVMSAPVLRGRITERAVIDGDFTRQEAEAVASVLNRK